MRFALLGDHADGLDFARALVATGRHELAAYFGPRPGVEFLVGVGIKTTYVQDLEEILADPGLEAVIVGSRIDVRPEHLRRALQSERHVLCVHPADQTPDVAYEAAMIQADTRCVLLPLLPESLHPGVVRFAELARKDGPLGSITLVEMERALNESDTWDADRDAGKATYAGWDILRRLGGEIAAVSGLAPAGDADPESPLLVSGRFENGGLFRCLLTQSSGDSIWRFGIVGSAGRAELQFPDGWPGPAKLSWCDSLDHNHVEEWPAWNPWLAVIEALEGHIAAPTVQDSHSMLCWQTAIRSLELDDALRRSISCGRVSDMEYPEASEEVGFKSTMTLVGCGLLWLLLLFVILAAWFPTLGWFVVPVLIFFLGLQILRWLVPRG